MSGSPWFEFVLRIVMAQPIMNKDHFITE